MKHSRPSSPDPAKIDCGGCHGCCHQLVIVLPDDAPPPGGWRLDAARTPLPVLERRADGSCVYLDPLGLDCFARIPVPPNREAIQARLTPRPLAPKF